MKKLTLIIVFIYSFTIYAQINDSIPSKLLDVQKDYLYHLIQRNSGTNTTLHFKKPIAEDLGKLPAIKDTLKINLQIKNAVNTHFHIDETDSHDPGHIRANVFFILLKTTNGFIQRSGSGIFHPNKVDLSYKWRLEGDVLIFAFVSGTNNRFERYIP
ncbi:MAG: hypothetical protein FWB85_07920 [Chitinispirillia bacterium]|nr:hypothetical protein [Chitinispirillia bacterium]MCL2242217.1 hypothetical protein [Chitinispirillia bacterium]